MSVIRCLLLGFIVLSGLVTVGASAQVPAPDSQRIVDLESRVSSLEGRIRGADAGVAAWLFGAFCALWAQNTRRNPWLWFFLGVFFNVITVLVLLKKNADDKQATA